MLTEAHPFEKIAQVVPDGVGRKVDRRSIANHLRAHMKLEVDPYVEPDDERVVFGPALILQNADTHRVTYFIQAEDGGPIKIGLSTYGKVDDRLKSLQTGNPLRLVVRRLVHGDHEATLHKHFAAHRLGGEWFEAVPELAEPIGAIVNYEK